ncbi:Salicylate hydroxylase [Colletotrichum tanaceti]|uniref:Salicylate hydroxylase n=1 Tax=Colletotrichum tanaceti TaxID=1306861 RepID=A0A4U6XJ17_9PEZI|nr:Salicylate hydroxylase [Colletotrichum tanaceti]TKW55970.1 Salicylate hydroxylase [Colletotrichum tanaceti]
MSTTTTTTTTQEKGFEVAIVGGGIAGVILAISLARRNVPFTIYEKAHAFAELGVGLGMSPNAVRAMRFCDPAVREAFEEVTGPPIPWSFLDGTSGDTDSTIQFALGDSVESMRGCHRGQFLKRLVALLPEDGGGGGSGDGSGGAIRFGKQLVRVEEPRGVAGRLVMVFDDGTTAETDAVVGCDGIKSTTRAMVVGEDHPSAKCTYTHKYAYRGLVPMAQAVEILGPERTAISGVWMSHDAHFVSYPVAGRTMLNVIAHCTAREDWPSETQLTLPADMESCVRDIERLSPSLKRVIQSLKGVDKWGQFDLGKHPPPTYAKGRICLMGDAAHASTPHQGAGGGICIEDAAVMASLLAADGVGPGAAVEAAFATFDAHRRRRGEWLVESSRRAGQLFELKSEHGRDFEKVGAELKAAAETLWGFRVEDNIRQAVEDLRRRLEGLGERSAAKL